MRRRRVDRPDEVVKLQVISLGKLQALAAETHSWADCSGIDACCQECGQHAGDLVDLHARYNSHSKFERDR
jgi:hypothetical protein